MAFTFADLEQHLIDNNGIVTKQNVLNFRNHYFNVTMTANWLIQLVDLASEIDFVNSHQSVNTLYEKVITDYLLTDDDQSDIDGEWDVVTQAEGDATVTRLTAASMPNSLKKRILLNIDALAFRIDSQNLKDAIIIAKQ